MNTLTTTFQGTKLDLVDFDDPILYKETIPFDFKTGNAQELFENLKETLFRYKGYGLSANQVGIPYSVFVFGNGRTPESIKPYFNPRVTDVSGEEDSADEGCLSFPGLIAKIFRAKSLRLVYQDINGTVQSIQLKGLAARIVQHEMCHLQGKPFFAGFSRLKVEMMVNKCAKHSGIQYNVQMLMNLRK